MGILEVEEAGFAREEAGTLNSPVRKRGDS